RIFVYDSQGISSIAEMLGSSSPDIIEILPGVIGKIIDRFAESVSVPLIAGGLIETKAEVTTALQKGAIAVSTGKEELWYL
ncbi:MAG: glycerol-3-phosphate responsive antiterminator, partial [Clostridia bacterium]|nr:glycerol-3-phosphate responsive antiterminator [Clostridia bacterium]